MHTNACRIVAALCLSFAGAAGASTIAYTADSLPRDDGWTIINYLAYEPGHVFLDPPGILHMRDPSTAGGSAAHYYKDFAVVPDAPIVFAEWDVRSVFSDEGSFFAVERDLGGGYDARFEVTETGVVSGTQSVAATTTDAFHTYRLELEGTDYRVLQDGNLLLVGTAVGATDHGGSIRVHFGLSSSPGTAELFLDEIRFGPAAVPEPATAALVLLGLAGFGARRRRNSGARSRD